MDYSGFDEFNEAQVTARSLDFIVEIKFFEGHVLMPCRATIAGTSSSGWEPLQANPV